MFLEVRQFQIFALFLSFSIVSQAKLSNTKKNMVLSEKSFLPPAGHLLFPCRKKCGGFYSKTLLSNFGEERAYGLVCTKCSHEIGKAAKQLTPPPHANAGRTDK